MLSPFILSKICTLVLSVLCVVQYLILLFVLVLLKDVVDAALFNSAVHFQALAVWLGGASLNKWPYCEQLSTQICKEPENLQTFKEQPLILLSSYRPLFVLSLCAKLP